MPFSIKLSYAGTPAGTITYNAGTDTITVIGANSSHPAEFLDLYNADIAGGWGQITYNGNEQFSFTCKIVLGNGTSAGQTIFADDSVQVNFDQSSFSGYGQIPIAITDYVNFTLGTVINANSKTVKNGVSIFVNNSYTYPRFIVGSGTISHSYIFLYGSQFEMTGTTYMGLFYLLRNIVAWHCTFINTEFTNCVSPSFYNCVFLGSLGATNDGYLSYLSGSSILDKVSCFGGDLVAVTWLYGYQANYTNLLSRDAGYAFFCYNMSVNNYLINPDVDVWNFYPDWGVSTGKLYRQITFDLFVLNGALTDFVEDANVTLTHDGTVFGSWLTNSTGQIDTETLTYGFYNQTGGNTMYGGTPWTLTITHPDWETYTSAFYPYSEIDWSISMQDTSTSNNNMLIVGLLVGSLAFLGLVVIRRKQN